MKKYVARVDRNYIKTIFLKDQELFLHVDRDL